MPALKKEIFVSTLKNYASSIEFQLSQYRFSNIPDNKMQDWVMVSNDFLQAEYFGRDLDDSKWLLNELNSFINNQMSGKEKAKKIFSFVQDNFTCVDSSELYLSLNATLKSIYKKRSGAVSDINLLLIAMLKQAGVKAEPMIMSTRDHGVVHPVYPILKRYNYVICRAIINDTVYYLDASSPYVGFNRLPQKCYNGLARLISVVDTASVRFSADSLKEFTSTTLFIANDDDKKMIGKFFSTLGYYHSVALREQFATQNKKDYFKDLSKDFPDDVKTDNFYIDSLKQNDMPLGIGCELSIAQKNENVIYLNPLFGQGVKENPFNNDVERLYPIEMPYCIDDFYLLNMEIPTGYKVEEIPKSVRIKLNENAGVFEYIIQQNKNSIQLRCRLTMNKAIFDADDFTALKDFYSSILKKESEQIVFRKSN